VKRLINPPPPGSYSAFCGIGNPASFRFTLEQCGIDLKEFRVFPDHHDYRAEDLAGMDTPLLTTSKDAVKLPVDIPPVRIVQMEIQVPDEEEILKKVLRIIELSS
jgi:tetraacyldisaccharide 4'-kinase